MKTIPLFQVDAFTSQPFSGNPAAVCLLDKAADARWMQAVGAEMNLSETAFVWREADGFGLRWFTPTVEVDLCGHATLATAHILWQEGWLVSDATARFYTRSGVLTAQLVGKRIVLDFPATPATTASAPTGLLAALDVTDAAVFSNHVDYLVLLESEAEVRRIQVDFAALKACQVTRGIIVTAAAHGTEYDFVSRFFAPAAGIDEDPVTGSAHCTLAPFWAERLGKNSLQAYQASARGGEVLVEWLGERVLLAGSAVTVFSGTLWV
ncbi:MAG: PhzF family phenazine biosynthesis protein [Candidatus Thiothrix putei]|uniref:PhzF family phenazine biosynthesis protein n=1 Tax=Candidatus Thiothrix putei TaxID=3080811 RepID=A0AA95HHP4_9GAMM|nr:MAG: PhzF family phenazine biosynthesis protein [Candidatus Thiothrix putei]